MSLKKEDLLKSLTETATASVDQPDPKTDDTVDLTDGEVDKLLGNEEDTLDVEDIGLDEQEAIDVMAMAMDALSEQMNIVRLNKQTKLLNLTNRSALVMAKRANDPLYAKYAKFNKIRRDIRDQIVKKYGSRAASYARKVMNRSAAGQTAPATK